MLGMRVTVHAGEAAGPESMWQAIRELGAERIGHGVKAIQDPALMAYLAEHRIGIESCLTSNVQTTTVASLTEHPIRQFLAAGVLACLNTDDPAVEGIDLPHEYEVAAPAAGMTASENPQRPAEWPDPGLPEPQRKSRTERPRSQPLIHTGTANKNGPLRWAVCFCGFQMMGKHWASRQIAKGPKPGLGLG